MKSPDAEKVAQYIFYAGCAVLVVGMVCVALMFAGILVL